MFPQRLTSARGPGRSRQAMAVARYAAFALAVLMAMAVAIGAPGPAAAQFRPDAPVSNPGMDPFKAEEIVDTGHRFFGTISRGLALTVQEAFKRWGEPNGYILGQEAGGAFVGGLRFGEGILYTRNAGQHRIFWQGPSIGFDFGGEGARTMMLVYQLPSVEAIHRRFVGVDGSAYLVGGFGMTALSADYILVVPVRSGVGARLGMNFGYLKFTPQPTWNPF